MTVIEMQEKLFEKLQSTDYAIFDGEKNEAIDFIRNNLLDVVNYVDTASKTSITLSMMNKRNADRHDIESIIQTKDEALETAAKAIKSLNNMCKKLDLPPFFNINPHDKEMVAKAAIAYSTRLYDIGISKGRH